MFVYLPFFLMIFIGIILFITYIRKSYGFWFLQPVFHVYDFQYMIFPPGIINNFLPKKNKYTNFKNIETILFSELSELKLNKLINFIQWNYLKNGNNTYSPEKNNIIPYFTSHNGKCFFSFYQEEVLYNDLKKGTIVDDTKVIGCMTTRPVHVIINNKDKDSIFDAYYVDYLCVDKTKRKKGIAPELIQTHHYNQSYLDKNICVSIFKREQELTGIVPMCYYITYGFEVKKWTKPINLHPMFVILEINGQNCHFLFDFIKMNSHKFDLIINTEISNIIELLKTKNIFIYTIMLDQKIICCYFFRKSCTFIDKDLEVLSCFASIDNGDSEDIFIQGFKISFWEIAEKNNFGFSAIENISHNDIILNNIILKTKPIISSPTAYFFYNFAYPTFPSNKVLIIN